MARRARRYSANNFSIANRRLEFGPRRMQALAMLEALRRQALRAIEDRRTYHPQGRYRPVRDVRSRQARITVPPASSGSQFKFADPLLNPGSRAYKLFHTLSKPHHNAEYSRKLALCIRRKMRAEVLFAAGKAGGGGIRRTRKRNDLSNVHC